MRHRRRGLLRNLLVHFVNGWMDVYTFTFVYVDVRTLVCADCGFSLLTFIKYLPPGSLEIWGKL